MPRLSTGHASPTEIYKWRAGLERQQRLLLKGASSVSSCCKCPISFVFSLWPSADGAGAHTAASGHGSPSAAGAAPCSSRVPGSPSLQRLCGSAASPGGHNTGSLMRGGRGAPGGWGLWGWLWPLQETLAPSWAALGGGSTGCPWVELDSCPGTEPLLLPLGLGQRAAQEAQDPRDCPTFLPHGGTQVSLNTGLAQGLGQPPAHPNCLTSLPP